MESASPIEPQTRALNYVERVLEVSVELEKHSLFTRDYINRQDKFATPADRRDFDAFKKWVSQVPVPVVPFVQPYLYDRSVGNFPVAFRVLKGEETLVDASEGTGRVYTRTAATDAAYLSAYMAPHSPVRFSRLAMAMFTHDRTFGPGGHWETPNVRLYGQTLGIGALGELMRQSGGEAGVAMAWPIEQRRGRRKGEVFLTTVWPEWQRDAGAGLRVLMCLAYAHVEVSFPSPLWERVEIQRLIVALISDPARTGKALKSLGASFLVFFGMNSNEALIPESDIIPVGGSTATGEGPLPFSGPTQFSAGISGQRLRDYFVSVVRPCQRLLHSITPPEIPKLKVVADVWKLMLATPPSLANFRTFNAISRLFEVGYVGGPATVANAKVVIPDEALSTNTRPVSDALRGVVSTAGEYADPIIPRKMTPFAFRSAIFSSTQITKSAGLGPISLNFIPGEKLRSTSKGAALLSLPETVYGSLLPESLRRIADGRAATVASDEEAVSVGTMVQVGESYLYMSVGSDTPKVVKGLSDSAMISLYDANPRVVPGLRYGAGHEGAWSVSTVAFRGGQRIVPGWKDPRLIVLVPSQFSALAALSGMYIAGRSRRSTSLVGAMSGRWVIDGVGVAMLTCGRRLNCSLDFGNFDATVSRTWIQEVFQGMEDRVAHLNEPVLQDPSGRDFSFHDVIRMSFRALENVPVAVESSDAMNVASGVRASMLVNPNLPSGIPPTSEAGSEISEAVAVAATQELAAAAAADARIDMGVIQDLATQGDDVYWNWTPPSVEMLLKLLERVATPERGLMSIISGYGLEAHVLKSLICPHVMTLLKVVGWCGQVTGLPVSVLPFSTERQVGEMDIMQWLRYVTPNLDLFATRGADTGAQFRFIVSAFIAQPFISARKRRASGATSSVDSGEQVNPWETESQVVRDADRGDVHQFIVPGAFLFAPVSLGGVGLPAYPGREGLGLDHCLDAVPSGVFQAVEFAARLPPLKRQALTKYREVEPPASLAWMLKLAPPGPTYVAHKALGRLMASSPDDAEALLSAGLAYHQVGRWFTRKVASAVAPISSDFDSASFTRTGGDISLRGIIWNTSRKEEVVPVWVAYQASLSGRPLASVRTFGASAAPLAAARSVQSLPGIGARAANYTACAAQRLTELFKNSRISNEGFLLACAAAGIVGDAEQTELASILPYRQLQLSANLGESLGGSALVALDYGPVPRTSATRRDRVPQLTVLRNAIAAICGCRLLVYDPRS